MVISMLKIRRPLGRLIFNMGIAIPGKTVFLIETAPCSLKSPSAKFMLLDKYAVLDQRDIHLVICFWPLYGKMERSEMA